MNKKSKSLTIGLPKVVPGPKKSTFLEWKFTPKITQKLLKLAEKETYTLKELAYQEEGHQFRKIKHNVKDLVLAAFLIKVLCLEAKKFTYKLKNKNNKLSRE